MSFKKLNEKWMKNEGWRCGKKCRYSSLINTAVKQVLGDLRLTCIPASHLAAATTHSVPWPRFFARSTLVYSIIMNGSFYIAHLDIIFGLNLPQVGFVLKMKNFKTEKNFFFKFEWEGKKIIDQAWDRSIRSECSNRQ